MHSGPLCNTLTQYTPNTHLVPRNMHSYRPCTPYHPSDCHQSGTPLSSFSLFLSRVFKPHYNVYIYIYISPLTCPHTDPLLFPHTEPPTFKSAEYWGECNFQHWFGICAFSWLEVFRSITYPESSCATFFFSLLYRSKDENTFFVGEARS